MILNKASDGAPSGSERVKELTEYTPQGLVLSGTFNGPLIEVRVSRRKMRVLPTSRLDPWDTWR